jgi:phenylpropionate dioxygenase-like ring-hydroxylating dioxygenase large terminal subunit
MGDLMRQYWIPALMSKELPQTDGAPVRVRLLGENLIAFRDSAGQVGLIQNHCPHRGASLFFGRNEECGLRCAYHGWKFDVSGRCVDMPNEPAESNFKDKVRAVAYPCVERGGVVWTYMGPHATPPALPDLEPNMVPEPSVWTVLRECNWLQALEGDIDTSHFGFLHMGLADAEDMTPGTFDYYVIKDRRPRYLVIDTDFGTMYGAYRPATPDTYYWRTAAFLFPFWTMIPTGVLGVEVRARAWVPIDDEHTMFWHLELPRQGSNRPGRRDGYYLPNTTDWLGRWRLRADARNDYLIDRGAQRTASYTGIDDIHTQDQMVTESMGPIYDRTQEHLASADAMIIRTRQRLLRAAVALREQGTVPPGVDDPQVYGVRTGSVVLPRDVDWLEGTEHLRKAFVEHPDLIEQKLAGKFGRF